MASFVHKAIREKLVEPPAFMQTNLHYEVMMGSRAYGINSPDSSDYDVYGFCIPPKDMVFPHTAGIVQGFGVGKNWEPWGQWQKHHVKDQQAGKEYDFTVYNIVKYFQLCLEANPNMIDSLFVPTNCVLYSTQVGQMVRDKRHWFLSKQVWKKFKGYAFSQLHSLNSSNKKDSTRQELIQKYGYDTKDACHLTRAINECFQILNEGDLDVQRDNEMLKAIRRGEWPEEEVRAYFNRQLPKLEDAYSKSKLPEYPDQQKLQKLLLECLEAHYGNLSGVVAQPDVAVTALREIQAIVDKARHLLWDNPCCQ